MPAVPVMCLFLSLSLSVFFLMQSFTSTDWLNVFDFNESEGGADATESKLAVSQWTTVGSYIVRFRLTMSKGVHKRNFRFRAFIHRDSSFMPVMRCVNVVQCNIIFFPLCALLLWLLKVNYGWVIGHSVRYTRFAIRQKVTIEGEINVFIALHFLIPSSISAWILFFFFGSAGTPVEVCFKNA